MTDIRTRLADALQFHLGEYALHHGGKGLDTYLADVLLSLPGIAIVELPEGRPVLNPRWRAFVKRSPETASLFAAALLAAANAAEADQ
jgi:hypothetical protein